MVVYLLEDHELPLVSMTATMRTGGWLDPAEKIGWPLTGSICGPAAGAECRPSKLTRKPEQFAGDLGISIGRQSGSAIARCAQQGCEAGVQILQDLFEHPPLSRRGLNWPNCRLSKGFAAGGTAVRSLAASSSSLLYGTDHPSAREGSIRSVTRITEMIWWLFTERPFIKRHHVTGVTGDFDKSAMLALLREVFGDWKRRVPALTIADTTPRARRRSLLYGS
jgi:hypothetical protein